MPDKTRKQLVEELNEALRKVAELKSEASRLGIADLPLQQEYLTENNKNSHGKPSNDPSCNHESIQVECEDTIDVELFRSLMDDFFKLTNIGIGIVDRKGNVLVKNEWQEICSKFHRGHPETREKCLESYLWSTRDMKEGEYRLYKCQNNMWDLISPIFINGRHVVNIFLGQFFFEDETPNMDVFITQAEKYRFEKDEYLSLLQRVPRWSKEKLDTVMSLYTKFASTIGHLSYSNLMLAKTIRKHRRALDALRESEDRFAKVFRCAPVMITLSNLEDGNYSEINDKFVEVTGYSRDEAIGKSSLDLGVISLHDRIKWIQELKTTGRVSEVELTIFTKSKREVRCIGSCEIISTKNGPQLLSLGYDITDRIRAEQEKEVFRAQFLQSQKMEAIGNLAGGIAHDFNNLLQIIIGYSEILLQNKKESGPEIGHLNQIHEAGKRGANLVKNLMTFSRRAENKPGPINVNDQIKELERLLTRTIPRMITIETILAPDLPMIEADPTQIDQVLMNLSVNAKDAIVDQGKVTIQTDTALLDEDYCLAHVGIQPGVYVRLTFSDSGQGMDSETLTHIFEPFFTTKSVGKGTGLGLSTVYSIVHQHGGSIDCQSVIGFGTTFRIHFPAVGC